MTLVFIFLCAINQENAMTLERTLDVHKNLARWKGPDYDKLDKAKNFFLLRVLLKKKVPKLLHLEQIETNVHGKENSLVFRDP